MLARLSHTRLLRYAGLFTWAMVGLPLAYSWLGPLLGSGDDDLALRPMPWQGWIAYLAFGAGYGWLTRGLGVRTVNSIEFYFTLKKAFASQGRKEETLKRVNARVSQNEVEQWLKIFSDK